MTRSDTPQFKFRSLALPLALLVLLALTVTARAQQITYHYDALGRLIIVASPEGIAEYRYDAVGNILQIITRGYGDVSGGVAILSVSPNQGPIGAKVHIYGQGFGATPADNQVAFNGTVATVIAAATNSLTVSVPPAATTGVITLTSPLGFASSPEPFTVRAAFAVDPEQTTLLLGKQFRFRATLDGQPVGDATWQVEDVPGGNGQVGTIVDGLYTAPAAMPSVNPVRIQALRAGGLATAFATLVPVAGGGTAAPVRVSIGPGQPAAGGAPVTGVPVSIGPRQPPLQATPLAAAAVGVSVAPVITGATPATAARGTTVSVTLTGLGLDGATALAVLKNNAVDPDVSVTDLSVAAGGFQATATVAIGGTATVGSRVVRITTPIGTSTAIGTGSNTFAVQ